VEGRERGKAPARVVASECVVTRMLRLAVPRAARLLKGVVIRVCRLFATPAAPPLGAPPSAHASPFSTIARRPPRLRRPLPPRRLQHTVCAAPASERVLSLGSPACAEQRASGRLCQTLCRVLRVAEPNVRAVPTCHRTTGGASDAQDACPLRFNAKSSGVRPIPHTPVYRASPDSPPPYPTGWRPFLEGRSSRWRSCVLWESMPLLEQAHPTQPTHVPLKVCGWCFLAARRAACRGTRWACSHAAEH
jgi:hypothetical protein